MMKLTSYLDCDPDLLHRQLPVAVADLHQRTRLVAGLRHFVQIDGALISRMSQHAYFVFLRERMTKSVFFLVRAAE